MTPEERDYLRAEVDQRRREQIAEPSVIAFVGGRGTRKPRVWTKAAVRRAFHAWAADHNGQPPSSEEWELSEEGRPTRITVRRLYGTWTDGVRDAGLVPRNGGRRAGETWVPLTGAQRVDIVRRARNGESRRQIARSTGVPLSSVCRIAKAAA